MMLMERKHRCCQCGCEAHYVANDKNAKLRYFCEECIDKRKLDNFTFRNDGFKLKDDESIAYVSSSDMYTVLDKCGRVLSLDDEFTITEILTTMFIKLRINNSEEIAPYNSLLSKFGEYMKFKIQDSSKIQSIEYQQFYSYFMNEMKKIKFYF